MIGHLLLAAAALAGAQLDAVIRSVAALPGEPRIVSAAAVGRDEVWTIENPAPFETDRKLRLVILGPRDGSERAARTAVDMVRWYKTAAPASVRDRWDVSALPIAAVDGQRLRHWVQFQAPDLVIDVDESAEANDRALFGDDEEKLGHVRVVRTQPAAAVDAIGRELTAHAAERSPLREAIVKRVARDPLAIARLLANRYPQTPSMGYIPAVAWVTTLRVAALTGDETFRTKVREQTQPWMSGEKPLFGPQIPLTAVAGTMIFAELAQNDDAAAAQALATQGAALASARKESGLAQHGQGWTDDMFMASAVLARTGRMAGRAADLDRAARLLVDYADRLQRPDAIFVHATDGPVAWGRGNGFAALGLMEALTALPARHPERPRVLEIYRRLMAGVSALQAPDGMWRQVLDQPGAYREETATAMLLAAMARGVRLGWIDKKYATPVARAWRALSAHIGDDGALVDVCASTGAGPTLPYYLDRPAVTGYDDRGGAMALLAAVEMHELSRR